MASGRILRARYLFLREHGEAGYRDVLEQLPITVRDVVSQGFLETRWYPFDILEILSETIDRVLGDGDGGLYYQMGRDSCERNLTTVHRLLFKFGNVGWLLDRVAQAWRLQYDTGTMNVVERELGHRVTLQLDGIDPPSWVQCHGVTGWMVRAAELTGEDRFACNATCRALGHAHCQWRFEWTP